MSQLIGGAFQNMILGSVKTGITAIYANVHYRNYLRYLICNLISNSIHFCIKYPFKTIKIYVLCSKTIIKYL